MIFPMFDILPFFKAIAWPSLLVFSIFLAWLVCSMWLLSYPKHSCCIHVFLWTEDQKIFRRRLMSMYGLHGFRLKKVEMAL